jgi:hypothetical protein
MGGIEMEEGVEVIQVIALLCRHGIYLLARLPDASIVAPQP